MKSNQLYTNGSEVSRLLTAAVINKKFCSTLLTDPAAALAVGFNGETFQLAREDRERILAIRATNLAEFARKLTVPRPAPAFRTAARFQPDAWLLAAPGLD